MKSKKKNRFKLPSIGVLMSILISTIPVLLLFFGVQNLAFQLKSQRTKVLGAQKIVEQYCKDSDISSISSQGLVPEQIQIDKLGLILNIFSQPLKNGTWEVSQFGANYAEGTSTIKLAGGNVGLFGHNSQQIFGNIKNLSEGDEISIFSGKYKASYVVTQSFTSSPSDVDVFFETIDPVLTLVTCEGDFFEKRYIIRAKLEKLEQINCDE